MKKRLGKNIHSVKFLFFSSSFSSYHPGGKWLVRHGIESIFRCPPTSSDDLCLPFCLILVQHGSNCGGDILDGGADMGVNVPAEHVIDDGERGALDDNVPHAAHKVGVGVQPQAAGPRMTAQE